MAACSFWLFLPLYFALRWRELSLAHAAEAARLGEVHRQERELLRHEQADIYQHEHAKFKQLDNPARLVEMAMSAQGYPEANASAAHAHASSGAKRPRP